jgi:DNA-directed RNA polymerase subunit E'/Rpb7
MLFVPIKFKTSVQLYPAELDVKYQDRLLDKIKEEYEGICSKYGFIRQNSIEIIKRSCGVLQKAYFNGAIRFEVLCRAEVCNPVQGSIVEAIVKNKNQLGILAESYIEMKDNKSPILDIIIPTRSAGIISQVNLDQIQVGETIYVEVMGKKYQMKDRKISIIGRVVIPENKQMEAVITEEEEEVDPALEEEDFVDIPAEEDAKKEGGAEDEEEEEDDDDDEDDASSLLSQEDDDFDEDFEEENDEDPVFLAPDDD